MRRIPVRRKAITLGVVAPISIFHESESQPVNGSLIMAPVIKRAGTITELCAVTKNLALSDGEEARVELRVTDAAERHEVLFSIDLREGLVKVNPDLVVPPDSLLFCEVKSNVTDRILCDFIGVTVQCDYDVDSSTIKKVSMEP